MNKLSQIAISATVGSLLTLAVAVSPLFAQNKTATPTPPANSIPGMPNHQPMMNNMSEMMEMMQQCQSMMGRDNIPTGTQHQQHHPANLKRAI